MPKSRGRRKTTKKSPPRHHAEPLGGRPARGHYDVGRFSSPTKKIVHGLLLNQDVPPDLLVELLPAMLWLESATGKRANLCTSSCTTLHFAYAALGIQAQPRAVDLFVVDKRTGQRTLYGRPDPHWSGSTFHGHCVLWLPASRRILDPTVEQYPQVRRYQLGPICGRLTASMALPGDQDRLARGELPPGSHLAVKREELLLVYTAVSEEFDDVVMSAPAVRDNLPEVQRSGRNLASWTLDVLREPDIIERARRAPHPRLRALLDLLAGAETIHQDGQDMRFVLADDPAASPRTLDELNGLLSPRADQRTTEDQPQLIPVPRATLPSELPDLPHDTVVDIDAAGPTPPDDRPRRGLLARLRRR